MNSRRSVELNHSTARTLAATVGAFPVALAVGIALTLSLPCPPNLRLTIGSYAVFPIWVSLACLTFLAPNARRAWLRLLAALCVAACLALLGLRLGPPSSWGR